MYRLLVFCVVCVGTFGEPGGWNDVSVNDNTVQEMASFAAATLDSSSNSLYPSRLLEVVTASYQIVSGMKYNLTINLGELDCMRGETLNLDLCSVQRVQECEVHIWFQVWLSHKELTHFSCKFKSAEESRNKRSLPLKVGGQRQVDISSATVTEAVNYALNELTAQSNGMYSVELHRIVEGTQQVVAGVLLRLKVEFVLSACSKSSGVRKALSECSDSAEKHVVECDVEILDQAWRQPRHTLNKHHCFPVPSSKKVLYYKSSNRTPKFGWGKQSIDSAAQFEAFKQQYGKQYDSVEEEQKRLEIFKTNMEIAQTIQLLDQGSATYGASPFADLTIEEFKRTYLPRMWNLSPDSRLKQAEIPDDTPPDEFDWRQHNAVTDVKNQGSCGSCWAFSVTGNIEGQWAIKKKSLISLSEQELVDCDKLDEGCNGGLPANAYVEIQRLGGLETEQEYPYKGDDEKCNFVKQDARVYINGSLNISKDETEMKAWIYKNGPASIGINAFAMQFYLGGISHPWKIFCAPDFLDHGVLITGYGIKKGLFGTTPYWAIKNSWGSWWGEKGYYLVYRGGGVCGLNQMVSSATVDG